MIDLSSLNAEITRYEGLKAQLETKLAGEATTAAAAVQAAVSAQAATDAASAAAASQADQAAIDGAAAKLKADNDALAVDAAPPVA